jgi:DNA-binding IclR family transcriptional regulator
MLQSVTSTPVTHVLARIRAEYLEMPGLSLTLQQGQRLWGVDRSELEPLLRRLVEAGFLARLGDRYVLRTSIT